MKRNNTVLLVLFPSCDLVRGLGPVTLTVFRIMFCNLNVYCFAGEGVSEAIWNDEMGMTEVVKKKGKMWTITGIVRNHETYCSIEETLYATY